MISCSEVEEFSPFGWEHISNNIKTDVCKSSNDAYFQDITRKDFLSTTRFEDWWTIRKSNDGITEEELYFYDNIVVWSHGQTGIKGSKSVVKSMTCDEPVLQTFFATFYTYPDLPALVGDEVVNEPTGEAIPSICIFTAKYLLIYTDSGEDFSFTLPFSVKKAWPVKFGVMFERQLSAAELAGSVEKSPPIIYSLFHPLDEIVPVIFSRGKLSVFSQKFQDEKLLNVISTYNDPSICILYASASSSLRISRIRRARQDENMTLLQNSVLGGSCFGTPAGRTLEMVSRETPLQAQKNRSFAFTPMVGGLAPQHYFSSVKKDSPSLMRLGHTPSPCRSVLSAKLSRSVLNQSMRESSIESEPLIPELCIEALWATSCPNQPTSSFLSEDFNGQKYIVLVFNKQSILKCYKFKFSETDDQCLLGSEEVIQAKDAVPLSELNMLVIIDCSNTLLLYSGVTYICRLHLAGLSTLNSTLFKDFSYLNISSKVNTSLNTSIRRSSLLNNVKFSAQAPKFETGLSPVQTSDSVLDVSYFDDPSLPISSSIVCVRDATDSRLTLVHSSGTMYRVGLPKMYSSILIKKSLMALKHILPADLFVLLLSKWYVHRNTPGCGEFSPKSEWLLFFKALMLLIGYDIESLSSSAYLELSGSVSPNVLPKKFRATESGSDSDWEYILSSSYHETLGSDWSDVLNLHHLKICKENKSSSRGSVDKSAPFYSYIPSILFAFHLLYEEFKIYSIHWDFCSYMIPCLTQLASDLRASLYLDHYWKDFPALCSMQGQSVQLTHQDVQLLHMPSYFTFTPPCIHKYVYSTLFHSSQDIFPYIPDVCEGIKNVIAMYKAATDSEIVNIIPLNKFLKSIDTSVNTNSSDYRLNISINVSRASSASHLPYHEKLLMVVDKLGMQISDVDMLSPSLSLIFTNAQYKCSNQPSQNWPLSVYQLTDRMDLFLQSLYSSNYQKEENKRLNGPPKFSSFKVRVSKSTKSCEPTTQKQADKAEDGMDSIDYDLLAFRWPEDQRIKDVRQMLCSSRPVKITITQNPGVSDHDFLEEQERQLYALCIRTMALPLGRGMFTLCTSTPVITEALPIPQLNLKGKAPPRGTTIEFPMNEAPADMDMWPLFHNGVSSGLKIAPNTSDITSTWIAYNKPRGELSQSFQHAGFLMALGLNGHLKGFATVSLHEYLSQSHELICVGLLIGISAAMRGTMDRQVTKMLSVHLECLLPPTATELDVAHNVQVAAILGIGLVYAGTGHLHMMEVLLEEIGRPPGPEMENANDRESYSLAAGLSLGTVMFGKGSQGLAYSDLNLSEELHHYIVGGYRKPLNGIRKERYKSPSYQIKEGDRVNINVTSPGATMALGMVFFRSGNKSVAEWMNAPDTPYMLDQVRPDFLQLRTIAKGLILWDEVVPSYGWVESHVPTTILQHVHHGDSQSAPGVDYESVHQAYYNILAGACFVLGLKFAGSANSEAFYVLWKYTRMFANFTKRSVAELAGKSTIETCLCTILLSLSMVMAGTGDLEVLRIIRYLRSRVGINVSTVGYGSHMAIHMALGFLFMGGGRFSLNTSDWSIPALIISCFPKFPTHSNDNRYHLQAFRHLYVLASEPRLFTPVDVDTGKIRMADILLRFSDEREYQNELYVRRAPHMLPELEKLREIEVLGSSQMSKYWPVKFTKGTDSWKVLENLLASGCGVPLKLRRIPAWEAPDSDRVRADTTGNILCHWALKHSNLNQVFGEFSDVIESLLSPETDPTALTSRGDLLLVHTLLPVVYEYLYKGKINVIANWVNALHAIRKFSSLSGYSSFYFWQIKLMCAVCCFTERLETAMQAKPERLPLTPFDHSPSHTATASPSTEMPLFSPDKFCALSVKIKMIIDTWCEDVQTEIKCYLRGDTSKNFSGKCALVLQLLDIPPPQMREINRDDETPISILKNLRRSKLSLNQQVALAKSLQNTK